MPDLKIQQGDLEGFSSRLHDLSGKVAHYATLPLSLAEVRSAMPDASSCTQAIYAGEHMEEQIRALKASLADLADNVKNSANQFQAIEEINEIAIQMIMASIPVPCPPVGLAKGQ